jgi:hypothetical protein
MPVSTAISTRMEIKKVGIGLQFLVPSSQHMESMGIPTLILDPSPH